jgi:hypothetical protein
LDTVISETDPPLLASPVVRKRIEGIVLSSEEEG